jgi:hypothetical protein
MGNALSRRLARLEKAVGAMPRPPLTLVRFPDGSTGDGKPMPTFDAAMGRAEDEGRELFFVDFAHPESGR